MCPSFNTLQTTVYCKRVLQYAPNMQFHVFSALALCQLCAWCAQSLQLTARFYDLFFLYALIGHCMCIVYCVLCNLHGQNILMPQIKIHHSQLLVWHSWLLVATVCSLHTHHSAMYSASKVRVKPNWLINLDPGALHVIGVVYKCLLHVCLAVSTQVVAVSQHGTGTRLVWIVSTSCVNKQTLICASSGKVCA